MSHIMIVDDDKTLCDAVACLLRKEGYEVTVYGDPESAFAALKSFRPDLIILDVMFPENASGGFDFARKAAKEAKTIPILMFTAVNSYFQFDFGARDIDEEWLPAVDFLEKPIDFEILKKSVADILAGGKKPLDGKTE